MVLPEGEFAYTRDTTNGVTKVRCGPAAVSQLEAAQTGFSEALLPMGNQDTLVKVAEAMSVQQFMGGKDLPDVIQKVFAGTPLEGAMAKVLEVAGTPKNGSAKSKAYYPGPRPNKRA